MTKAANETPEQRENRLVKARKQASKTREQAMKEKYRDKILEDLRKEEEESESEAPVAPVAPAPVVPAPAPAPAPEVPVAPAPAQCVKKPRKKPAAKIIVEQDSDDSDFFEDKPNIIFVKRITKKKENIPVPTYTPTQLPVYPRPSNPVPSPSPSPSSVQYPPPVPVRPPEMSPQQRLLMERCKNMSNGNFLPVSRPRM